MIPGPKKILSAIRFVAVALGRRLDAWWAGISLLTAVGFLLAAGAVTGFVAVADEVLEGETQAVDEAILRWLADVRIDWLDTVALQITALGNAATLIVVALSAAAILWAARRKVSVALLLVSLTSGTLVTYALKFGFDRPRPRVGAPIAEAITASFPSGHAMMAAVSYGTVAFLVGRMAPGRVRWITWAGAALLVVLVGVSRLYIGVHYPSDVVAGWLGGIAWTALLVLLFRLLGAFAEEMPELGRAEPELSAEA